MNAEELIDLTVRLQMFEPSIRLQDEAADAIESLSQQLTTVTAERDELVEALKYCKEHAGKPEYIYQRTKISLAKLGADKTGEK